jgi:CRISPR-associated protein Cas5d
MYRIYAVLDFIGETSSDLKQQNINKGLGIFTRRAEKGQCFSQPFLGCREFSANFNLITDFSNLIPPIKITKDLGWMLYDIDYKNKNPKFFRAAINNGTIIVPSEVQL